MSELRKEFEGLEKIKQVINEHPKIKYNPEMNRYWTLSADPSDALVTLYVDGAWYAFQEKQKQINTLRIFFDDLDHSTLIGNVWSELQDLLK